MTSPLQAVSLPELPDPTYIYHDSDEEGGDDLFEFARSGPVDIDDIYEGGVCTECKRLYTGDQMRTYAISAHEAEVGRLREVLERLATAAGDSVATGVIAAHLDSAYDDARAALTQGETK
jgi:hypothetical protein